MDYRGICICRISRSSAEFTPYSVYVHSQNCIICKAEKFLFHILSPFKIAEFCSISHSIQKIRQKKQHTEFLVEKEHFLRFADWHTYELCRFAVADLRTIEKYAFPPLIICCKMWKVGKQKSQRPERKCSSLLHLRPYTFMVSSHWDGHSH